MSRPLFDRIAVVDWSASATPTTGHDSIWIATLDVADASTSADTALTLTNQRTRHAALGEIIELAEPGRRTLLGVDFSLGFPAGTAAACGLQGTAWHAMWEFLGSEITDDQGNRNNRFAVADRINRSINRSINRPGRIACDAPAMPTPGPFWGCPPRQATEALTTTKPIRQPTWPGEWRSIETRLRTDAHRPFSAWQLLGAGAVGGQSLVGIAALQRLRQTLGQRMAIWPFTTGPALDAALDTGVELVVAEVWPSLWYVVVPPGVVKDAAQVESTVRRLARLDAAGDLLALFRLDFEGAVAEAVVEEEGWLLGVVGESI